MYRRWIESRLNICILLLYILYIIESTWTATTTSKTQLYDFLDFINTDLNSTITSAAFYIFIFIRFTVYNTLKYQITKEQQQVTKKILSIQKHSNRMPNTWICFECFPSGFFFIVYRLRWRIIEVPDPKSILFALAETITIVYNLVRYSTHDSTHNTKLERIVRAFIPILTK